MIIELHDTSNVEPPQVIKADAQYMIMRIKSPSGDYELAMSGNGLHVYPLCGVTIRVVNSRHIVISNMG